ncbi:MAG: double-strand break repair protein AddB [Pseudomonadota bacterium]
MGKSHNIASIPPGAPFLAVLVEKLLCGGLIQGFAPYAADREPDPLALANVTIWVPTRRAARSLATQFVTRLGNRAAVLPRIVTLGDGDEEGLEAQRFIAGNDLLKPTEAQAVDPFTHTLLLSRLVHGWASALKENERDMMGGGDIIMPSSLADAIGFAGELGSLMESIATEDIEWSQLHTLDVADHADWWQLTLKFLSIAAEAVPEILRARGLEEPARLRGRLIREQVQQYREHGSPGPVVAAGSTGSIPATAELLQAISLLPNGALVLPGLDRDLDPESWSKVDLPDNAKNEDGTAPGHPQYGLKKLLTSMDIDRENADIRHLALTAPPKKPGPSRVREHIVSEALRPSSTTEKWQDFKGTYDTGTIGSALKGVSIVEARGERQEALAVALALRETIETEGATAALVTPDRNLARRVAVEMRRFGVVVDDSAGQPLRNRPAGTFARLALAAAFGPADPIALIGLLKHPDLRLGLPRAKARHGARLLELAVLRGAVIPPDLGMLEHDASELRRKVLEDAEQERHSRTHATIARMSETDWALLLDVCRRLDEACAKVNAELVGGTQSLGCWARYTIAFLEALAADENGELGPFYSTTDGAALHGFLAQLLDAGDELETTADHWPDVFDALMGGRTVRAQGGTDPRVAILGPLEARLQTFERVVLGGLNEGTWPASARNDPFLSRPMKMQLGLPSPERRTGLAAHDFQMMMGMKDVVLTRTARADNAPTVASRWVQRLMLVAGKGASDAMRARGRKFTDWATAIDTPEEVEKSAIQPAPTPPVDVRPNKLSVTAVATWIEDPYAIYARHILGLQPLDPLVRDADARERGELYHQVFEEFVNSRFDPTADGAMEALLTSARAVFGAANIPQEFIAQWLPRFTDIAEEFLAWHARQIESGHKVSVERPGSTDEGLNGFTLIARADRIDKDTDGRFTIYDYKTGLSPTAARAKDMKAPQLPLEAAMTMRGAFGDDLQGSIAGFGYLRLIPGTQKFADMAVQPDQGGADTATQIADEVWRRLSAMIEKYRDQEQPYVSYNRPPKERRSYTSPYDHLARLGEWSNGAEDGAGDAP